MASLFTASACNNLATGHSIWLLQLSTHRTPVRILNTLRFLDVRSVVGADYYFNIFIATLCCYCLLVLDVHYIIYVHPTTPLVVRTYRLNILFSREYSYCMNVRRS